MRYFKYQFPNGTFAYVEAETLDDADKRINRYYGLKYFLYEVNRDEVPLVVYGAMKKHGTDIVRWDERTPNYAERL